MKIKKIPMRSCVVTKERYPKNELLRIVRNTDGVVEVDITGKKNGRGAYIKKDLIVLNQAIKTKVLEKHLEVSISKEVYENIEKIILEDK